MLKDKSVEQMFSELTPQESSDISGGGVWTDRGSGVWRSINGSIGSFNAVKGLTDVEQCKLLCEADINCTGIEYSAYIDPGQGPSLCELHNDPFGYIADASPRVNIETWTWVP